MPRSSSKSKEKIRILLADDHHIVGAGVWQLLESASDLQLIAGAGDGAVGMQLNISDRAVQEHLAHIFAKLQANSRTEAVMRAVSVGLISQNTGHIADE